MGFFGNVFSMLDASDASMRHDSYDRKMRKKHSHSRSNPYAHANMHKEDLNQPASYACIYKSELDYISRCILDYPNIETGGQLFGYWTNTGAPVVTYVIGPGSHSKHQPTAFFQDMDYLKTIGHELTRKFGLQHIGEWHSHHQLDLAHPSGGDVRTMVYAVQDPKFPRMLLCIGNCTPRETEINAFNFHSACPHEYEHAMWNIFDIDSPYRDLIDNALGDQLIHPRTPKASHGPLYCMQEQPSVPSQPEVKEHWLTKDVHNIEMMKAFVEDIQNIFIGKTVKTMMNDEGEPMICVNGEDIVIVLPFAFPQDPPKLLLNHVETSFYVDWNECTADLEEEFENWANCTLYPIASQFAPIGQHISDGLGEEVGANEIGTEETTENDVKQEPDPTQETDIETQELY